MRLHVEKGLDLAEGEVLTVAHGDKLVECAEKLKGIAQDLALIQSPADAGDDLGKQV